MAVSDLPNRMREVLIGQRVVRARPTYCRGFGIGGRRRDDGSAAQLGYLGQQQPDSAGRGMDEDCVAGMTRVGAAWPGSAQSPPASAAPLPSRRRCHRAGAPAWSAATTASSEKLPCPPASHPTRCPTSNSELRPPHPFHTGPERQRHRVEPSAVVDVDEVDPGDRQPHQLLVGAWDRVGNVFDPERLGTATLIDHHRAHYPSLCGLHPSHTGLQDLDHRLAGRSSVVVSSKWVPADFTGAGHTASRTWWAAPNRCPRRGWLWRNGR